MRFRSFAVSDLPVGLKLGCSVYDDRRLKLLAAGVQITQPLIDGLQKRRILSVLVSAADVGRMLAYRPQGSAKYAFPDRAGAAHENATNQTQILDLLLPDLLRIGATANGPEVRERRMRPNVIYGAKVTPNL